MELIIKTDNKIESIWKELTSVKADLCNYSSQRHGINVYTDLKQVDLNEYQIGHLVYVQVESRYILYMLLVIYPH